MTQDQSLISIITAAYNAEKTLAETIQSVIEQDWPHKEYVIVNDGSTDRTAEIAQSFAAQYPWINVINTLNQGVAKARNTAWKASSGNRVAILDADDVYLPKALGKLAKGLLFSRTQNSDTGLIYGNAFVFSEDTQEAEQLISPPLPASTQGALLRQLFIMNPVLPSASMFWREILERLNGWDETLAWGQERDIVHRAALQCSFVKADTPIVYYRRHEGQRTGNSFGNVRYGADLAQFKFIQTYGVLRLFPEANSAAELAVGIVQLADRILEQSRLKSFDTMLFLLYMARTLEGNPEYQKRITVLTKMIPQALLEKYGNGRRINIKENPLLEAEKIKEMFLKRGTLSEGA